MISLIAAVGQNREIGLNNNLIWHLKGDMQYFKKTTLNHKVVMGMNTYKSIGKPLGERTNIVLTTHPELITDKNIIVYTDIASLLKDINKEEEVFVIGGAKVYAEFLKYATFLYLTEIEAICEEANAYFPEFSKNEWHKEVLSQNVENNINYKFTKYERILK